MEFDSTKIKDLEYLSGGTFGSVYRYHDDALKFYRETVKTPYGDIVKNPCLKFSKRKLERLMKLNSSIHNTHLITDFIYEDNIFSGVVYPYHNGDILSNISFTPNAKKEVCMKLVSNAEELTNYNIYPLDYKLNNIMYTDSEKVEIIDLDDTFTHVRYGFSPILLINSINSLKRTISYFLDKKCFHSDQQFDRYLIRNHFDRKLYQHPLSYNYLKEYIESYNSEFYFIFINSDDISLFDYSIFNTLATTYNIKLILNFCNNETSSMISEKLVDCNKRGLPIFDFILNNNENDVENNIITFLDNYKTTKFFYFDSSHYFPIFDKNQLLNSPYSDIFDNGNLDEVKKQLIKKK